MFIYPTSKGHHVPDADLAVPCAVVPTVVNTLEEDEIEPEPDNDVRTTDPFMGALEDEDELYFDEFLDSFCGQHVHDSLVDEVDSLR